MQRGADNPVGFLPFGHQVPFFISGNSDIDAFGLFGKGIVLSRLTAGVDLYSRDEKLFAAGKGVEWLTALKSTVKNNNVFCELRFQ